MLDEGSFQQLLAAAYTVQRHSESSPANGPSGTSQVLSAIAEIQSDIRTRGLNIADSSALIAQQLLVLVKASGVSINLVDNGYLDCVAEAGTSAKIPGSSVSSHSLVATERLKLGHMFESENSQTDLRVDSELCRNLGVGSLVAAPVLRFGDIAGLVEVRWTEPGGFGEPELRTCRLMAGLVTGTLERSVRIGKPRSAEETAPVIQTEAPEPLVSTNHSEMLAEGDNFESNTPVLQSQSSPQNQTELRESVPQESQAVVKEDTHAKPTLATACRMCGRTFAGDEQFCGFCSMPRPAENRSAELQSKWASLWFMQRAQGALQGPPPPKVDIENKKVRFWALPPQVPAAKPAHPAAEPAPQVWPRRAPEEPPKAVHELNPPQPFESTFPFDERAPFSERTTEFAKRHWRDAILALFVVALSYGVVTAWPRSENQPTWFQSLMARAGIIHPVAKVFAGSPDARVWVDVHTQLYYCSGEDLYGKTPDGEFTTQYNAQSDGYQSASNTTCP